MGSIFLKSKIGIFIIAFLIFIGAMITYSMIGRREPSSSTSERVVLVTNMGNITIELYDDMPVTTANFKNLTGRGVYDGTIFHRVIKDFMIQGGDPTGTGLGDPSIPAIPDEFTDHNRNERGTVAMAKKSGEDGHSQPNSATSQFYINLVYNSHLDSEYSVFGRIVEGMDVVDSIGQVPTDSNDKPLQEVKVTKALFLK